MPNYDTTLVLEVCYRFFLFRPLISFALWKHYMYESIYIGCMYSYNPIMRVHKAPNGAHGSEPAVTWFRLLCAHKQNRRTLCVMFEDCMWLLLVLPLLSLLRPLSLLFFPTFSDLIGSGFSHRLQILQIYVPVYGNFHRIKFMDARRIFVFNTMNISLQLLSA